MKSGRPKSTLTDKEEIIMQMLWQHGPLFVRDMVELYPEPRPHFNTVATTVRILEQKGHVSHTVVNGSHRFEAVTRMDDVRRSRLGKFIKRYFNNSYVGVVSTLVEDEKISIDELRELINMVENQSERK